jgi:hypothetical protein
LPSGPRSWPTPAYKISVPRSSRRPVASTT